MADVASNVLRLSVPLVNARVNPLRSIAVLAESAPPSEKTLVDDAKDTPFVAVEVENCDAVVRQVPLTAKQPLTILTPLPKVDDAVVDVRLRIEDDTPDANVDVPCPAATVIAPPKVEVAVEVEMMLPVRN